ncbi:MAG: hypothetical protein WEE20_06215, partial [Bacteroidota bacterium]
MAATPKPSPRWLYALHALVQRLPIPGWLLGVLISGTVAVGLLLEAWRLRVLPPGVVDTYLVTVANYPIVLFAAWFMMDAQARRALTSFFAHSQISKAKLESILVDFVSLPNWIAIPGVLVGLLFGYFNYQLALLLSPLAGKVSPIFEMLGFVLVGAWVGLMFPRALRQTLLLRKFYAQIEVNIFNSAPLHALSRFSSQSSLALVLLNYLIILLSLPTFLITTNGYLVSIMLIGSVFVFFFVSVSGIHQRMRDEKDRLLSELGEGLNRETARLVSTTRRGSYAGIGEIRNTISSHKESLEIVSKIS